MTAFTPIPLMTDPLGRAWDQPPLSAITFYRNDAYMTERTFKQLANYSASYPTGVYPGKMWRRFDRDGWMLCWYGEEQNFRCPIERAKIVIADA